MSKPLLVIGNKNYSSWSLRAWLGLKTAGIDFDERVIPLDTPEFKSDVLAVSAAGRVPVLVDGAVTVWESLAILEWAAERNPQAWPSDPAARAHARAVSAEMHSSFVSLRSEMPMNMRAKGRRVDASASTKGDIERIQAIWGDCRDNFGKGGPYLFGAFTHADAMYAPVASRMKTYGVELDAVSRAYVDAIHEHQDIVSWRAAAAAETWSIPHEEVGG